MGPCSFSAFATVSSPSSTPSWGSPRSRSFHHPFASSLTSAPLRSAEVTLKGPVGKKRSTPLMGGSAAMGRLARDFSRSFLMRWVFAWKRGPDCV
jgi:hypothetical protein